MKTTIFASIMILSLASTVFSQTPAVDMILTVTDDAGAKQELHLGLDPNATVNIDTALGENELPPFPPGGVFEARFIGDDISLSTLGQGSYKDFREGNSGHSGTKTHELRFQPGTGSTIKIVWNFPEGVTGILQDLLGGVVVNKTMAGNDSVVVANPSAINKLTLAITYALTTALNQENATLPTRFILEPNYPNPFNPGTRIVFALPHQSEIQLIVYDINGKPIVELVNGVRKAGIHEIEWNGKSSQGIDVPSGTYIVRLHTARFSKSMNITKIK